MKRKWARRLVAVAVCGVLLGVDLWLGLTVWHLIQGQRDGWVFWTGGALIAVILPLALYLTVRAVKGIFRRAPALRSEECPYDQALLDRHAPIVCFDRQYDYGLLAAESAVENPGNLLRRRDGEVIARAGGDPPLTLDLLSAYRDRSGDDCIAMAPDYLDAARRWEAREDRPASIYGRIVKDGKRTWLQYWFWLYYNPKNVMGIGKHEGDWEMIQIGLDGDMQPQVATYAQHESGEARSFKPERMSLAQGDDGSRPLVFVARHSHASYFKPGRSYVYVPGIDHPDGDGCRVEPPVVPLGSWQGWPGRWGTHEWSLLGRVGHGPRSPAHQGLKWTNPSLWHGSLRVRWPLVQLGKLVDTLGPAIVPGAPRLTDVRSESGQVHFEYELERQGRHRARHLHVTLHRGERVVASRTIRDTSQGTVALAAPSNASELSLSASTFNWLGQRSEVVTTRPTAPPDSS